MAYANVPNDFGIELAVILMILQRFSGSWAKQVLTPTHISQSKHKCNNLDQKQTTLLTSFNISKDNNTFKYTHKTILLPLYRSTCPCWHHRVKNGRLSLKQSFTACILLLTAAIQSSPQRCYLHCLLTTQQQFYAVTQKSLSPLPHGMWRRRLPFLSVCRSRVTRCVFVTLSSCIV